MKTAIANPHPRPQFSGLRANQAPGYTRAVRDHFSAVLRRLNYLSVAIRTARPSDGRIDYYLGEFDAHVFMLKQVVGDALVDKWLGAFEIKVPSWGFVEREAG